MSSAVAQRGHYSKPAWSTAFFMIALSHRRRLGAASIHLVRPRRLSHYLLHLAVSRDRDGVSPAADPSVVQDSEDHRVFPDDLRDARSGRRTAVLGRHSSQTSSAFRHGPRSAHATPRRILGAHGLDSVRRRDAQRQHDHGQVRARPRQRQVPPSGSASTTGFR